MKRSEPHPVVADGRRRIEAAERARIEREIRARYAEESARAGFWGRLRLRFVIRREVEPELARALKEAAPPDALYSVAHRGAAEGTVAGKHVADTATCPTCGYNLTGNTSGICPECGQPVPQSEA